MHPASWLYTAESGGGRKLVVQIEDVAVAKIIQHVAVV